MTFELCGSKLATSLITYSYPITLIPCFQTSTLGVISPILSSFPISPPAPFPSSSLPQILSEFQDSSFVQNENFRTAQNKTKGYVAGNFITEGAVLYFLNSSNQSVSRNEIYKIKPKDFELSHSEFWDFDLQRKVFSALEKASLKYQSKEEPHSAKIIGIEEVKAELEMSQNTFKRYENNISKLIENRPNLNPNYLHKESNTNIKVIIFVGLPGSGKSTLANKIVKEGGGDANGNWVRVNQDELGTRKKCELKMNSALQKFISQKDKTFEIFTFQIFFLLQLFLSPPSRNNSLTFKFFN